MEEQQRRIEQLERDTAVVQDRQVRYDSAQALLLAKLDTIGRDVVSTRELLATGYVSHTAATLRNNEVDARFLRMESKMDANTRWLIGGLTTAVIALGLSAVKLTGHA